MALPHLPAEPFLSRSPRAILIIGCSLLWLASFPPLHLLVPPFIALVPFVWLLTRETRPRAAALVGFLTGLGANVLVMHWLPTTLWRHTPWALVLSILLIVLASIGWGLVGWVVVLVWHRSPRLPRWFVFAASWTAYEVLLDHLGPWSFPWLGLGVSLTGTPVLIQVADLAGTAGITFWLAAVNGVIADAVTHRLHSGLAAVAVTGSLVMVWGYGYVRESNLVVRELGSVALIQPNVGYDEKLGGDHDRIVEQAIRQTEADVPPGSVDLIVWPETSLPAPLPRHREWAASLAATAARQATPLLVGALTEDEAGSFGNGALIVPVEGGGEGEEWHTVYVKRRLVPVTERWLEPGTAAALVATPLGMAGVTICYESIFPDPFRRYRGAGSDLAIVITNDAWFGRTGGAAQHAAHTIVRAVETRQPVIRAANSGYTFVVPPTGRVTRRTRLFERTTLVASVPGGVPPPIFVRWGWSFGYAVLVAVLVMLASAVYPKWSTQTADGS